MTMHRLSAIAHAAYLDLRAALVDEAASDIIGTPRLEKRGSKSYWYDMFRVGSDVRKRYIGEDTPEMADRIARLQDLKQAAETRAKARTRLIRILRAEGARTVDPATGSLVTALAHGEPKKEFQALYGTNGSLRDASGRTAGSARSTSSTTTYRDASGRVTATASGFGPERLTYRDASGRTCGTASQYGARTTFRDASGRVTGTASAMGDRTTYRDASGRVVGTASRTGDSITFRDGSGRLTGTGPVRK